MEDMKVYMTALKEENLELKKELETIKKKINENTGRGECASSFKEEPQ